MMVKETITAIIKVFDTPSIVTIMMMILTRVVVVVILVLLSSRERERVGGGWRRRELERDRRGERETDKDENYLED